VAWVLHVYAVCDDFTIVVAIVIVTQACVCVSVCLSPKETDFINLSTQYRCCLWQAVGMHWPWCQKVKGWVEVSVRLDERHGSAFWYGCTFVPVVIIEIAFSALTLWLGVRKSIWPVKIEWCGDDVVICLEWGADCLRMVQLMPLPVCHPRTPSSLVSFKSRLVLPVPAYTGCPGKEAIKGV